MYHKIGDQEKQPEKPIDPSIIDDERFDSDSKTRQTQQTIGLYLKEKEGGGDPLPGRESQPVYGESRYSRKRIKELEKKVEENKCFWTGRPEVVAPLTYELVQKYSPGTKMVTRREQGIFYRPKFLELEHAIKTANAGLLHLDEGFSDSEDEPQPDTNCMPLQKTVYGICDPCKEEKEKKEPEAPKPLKGKEMRREGAKPPFKTPNGCQWDCYQDDRPLWDNPFVDKLDMLRQQEMNKVLKPYKHELLNKHYEKNPPVRFLSHRPTKKSFPVYQISNL